VVTLVELKALRNLDLKQQLLFVESYLPDAWEYLHDINGVPQPTFDDNDELVSWCATPQVTPQVTPQEEKE
jgi:hypothetical protein